MSKDGIPLKLQDLQEVSAKISSSILRTVQWHNEPLSALLGTSVFLKMENLQRTGSFKIRGATYKLGKLYETEPNLVGVIAASAGNHAQGVARAARQYGLSATVVMPQNAPITKIEACKAVGARVLLHGDNLEEAREEAQRPTDQHRPGVLSESAVSDVRVDRSAPAQ